VDTQSQQLADVRIKAKEDHEWMSGIYAKFRQEAKTKREEAQNKAENAE
jgi:hypothetical protein